MTLDNERRAWLERACGIKTPSVPAIVIKSSPIFASQGDNSEMALEKAAPTKNLDSTRLSTSSPVSRQNEGEDTEMTNGPVTTPQKKTPLIFIDIARPEEMTLQPLNGDDGRKHHHSSAFTKLKMCTASFGRRTTRGRTAQFGLSLPDRADTTSVASPQTIAVISDKGETGAKGTAVTNSALANLRDTTPPTPTPSVANAMAAATAIATDYLKQNRVELGEGHPSSPIIPESTLQDVVQQDISAGDVLTPAEAKDSHRVDRRGFR